MGIKHLVDAKSQQLQLAVVDGNGRLYISLMPPLSGDLNACVCYALGINSLHRHISDDIAVLILADLCLIPVGASNAEIWATSDILDLIKQATEVKPVEARMLWTRYRAHTRLAQELSGLASEELGLEALTASTGMRVAYMQALGEGLTVTELADTSARDEVKALTAEVKKLLKG